MAVHVFLHVLRPSMLSLWSMIVGINRSTGYFGDTGVRFAFVKYTNVFIIIGGIDCGLVVAYVFDVGWRKAIDFPDEDGDLECSYVTSNLCSI
jgi:hypothetical protein